MEYVRDAEVEHVLCDRMCHVVVVGSMRRQPLDLAHGFGDAVQLDLGGEGGQGEAVGASKLLDLAELGMARFHHSCSRLVTLTRWERGMRT